MKQNKTRWLFAATVAIFWLALLLTLALPKKSKSNETSTLSYAVPTNVTKLHIDDVNYLRTYSGANIKFTQDDHITLEIENSGLDQPPQDASIFFEQQGEQLVLRKLPVDTNKPDDNHSPSWRVTKISLPLTITEVSSYASDIKIGSNVQVPQLTIRSDGNIDINIDEANIGKVNIYSNSKKHCISYKGIKIIESSINNLYIESNVKDIEIGDSDDIKIIELHTPTSSNLTLMPISSMQRTKWQALEKENHLCEKPFHPSPNIKQDK